MTIFHVREHCTALHSSPTAPAGRQRRRGAHEATGAGQQLLGLGHAALLPRGGRHGRHAGCGRCVVSSDAQNCALAEGVRGAALLGTLFAPVAAEGSCF